MDRKVSRESVCELKIAVRAPLICFGPGTIIGVEAFLPDMISSPVKVVHVASRSASAWDCTSKYGKGMGSPRSTGPMY